MYRPDAEIKDYLKYIRDEYFLERLEEHGIYFKDTKYKQWWDIVYSDELITHFIKDLRFMQSIVILVNHDNDVLPMYERVIFENGQGLLLDQRLGLHTTPSNTGIENPMKILENAYKDIPGGWLRETGGIELCYVTRPYLTRHGADDMFQEADNMSFEDKTNVPNRWQGKLKFGYLDLCMLQKRVSTESSKILINQNLPRLFSLSSVLFVTHCDHSDYMTMHMEDNCTVFAPIRYKSYGPTVKNVTRCDT
jgi:adenylosuccinate synthase